MDDQKFTRSLDVLAKKTQMNLKCDFFTSKILVGFIFKSIVVLRLSKVDSDDSASFFADLIQIILNLKHVEHVQLRQSFSDIFDAFFKSLEEEINIKAENNAVDLNEESQDE